MKKILITAMITGLSSLLLAQQNQTSKKSPPYSIHLTTMDGNILKGILLNVDDSTITVYPGKRHDWKAHLDPVIFDHKQVQQIRLKRKNGTMKGILIGTASALVPVLIATYAGGCGCKSVFPAVIYPLIPIGMATGGLLGGKSFKKSNINGNFEVFTAFKMRFYAKQKN